jgi:hypothetical protein
MATLVVGLRWLELWAFLFFVATLALVFFFGMMAWMAGAPLVTARKWLRRSIYPGLVWLIARLAHRLLA